jgi:GH43 family beta-xylosidase
MVHGTYTTLLGQIKIWVCNDLMCSEARFSPPRYFQMLIIQGGSNPWSTYSYAGVLSNEWGIDGTVSVINRKRYFIWSCQRDKLQSLCIAAMTAPNKLAATRVISQPTNAWEKAEGKLPVNEGPAVMEYNGRYFMAYSASYCWTVSYSLGLLTLKPGGDPLDRSAWMKSGPVFKTANGNYGPGHNG